jgi:hypothetical protein
VLWYNTRGYKTLKLICMGGKILQNRSNTTLQTKRVQIKRNYSPHRKEEPFLKLGQTQKRGKGKRR